MIRPSTRLLNILVSTISNLAAEIWTVSSGAGENLRSIGYEGDYIVMPNGVDLPHKRVPKDQVFKATYG